MPPDDQVTSLTAIGRDAHHGPTAFTTTHWSVVLAAQGESPAAQQALEKLCRTYWRPIYGFVRRQGVGPGLTSRVTIIVGCVHGLIPYLDDDISPADWPIHIQEQRRVFYVALIRPKEILVISSAATLPRRLARQLGAIVQGGNRHVGHTVACEFIDELGPHAPDAQLGPTWAEQGFP